MGEDEEGARTSRGVAEPRRDSVRRFFIQITTILVVFMALGFLGLYLRTEALLADQALAQARSYVELIAATRSWNAHYEGVYVEKRPGVESNPFLVKLGLDPDLTTSDGRVLTLRNPALMTTEVSEILLRTGGAAFSLTSLKPVNPDNSPDAWERDALASFDSGAKEAWKTDRSGEIPLLRYMRPLVVESSCLRCHVAQGYEIGDIRGGVSVTVPLTSERRALRDNAIWLTAALLASTSVLLGFTYMLIRRLSGSLEVAEANLVRFATTDELTGIWNRRHTVDLLHSEIERARRARTGLAVVMIDIDRFKSVNDTFGHAAGDEVLRSVAAGIVAGLRPYDTVGRIGGEEFLIIAPGADLDDALALAERVRAGISAIPAGPPGSSPPVTISAGVALVDPDEEQPLDRALARADSALYGAKQQGRDRVSTAGPAGAREAEPDR